MPSWKDEYLVRVSAVLAGPTSLPDYLNHRWPTCYSPASAACWLRDAWPEAWYHEDAVTCLAVGSLLLDTRSRLMWQATRP